MRKFKWLVPTVYILFLMLPIYWLLNMSFKTTTEIINTYSLWPQKFTFENYITIFTDSTWYNGYLNSIYYVVMNTILSVENLVIKYPLQNKLSFFKDNNYVNAVNDIVKVVSASCSIINVLGFVFNSKDSTCSI